jgi:hypothetical protein
LASQYDQGLNDLKKLVEQTPAPVNDTTKVVTSPAK